MKRQLEEEEDNAVVFRKRYRVDPFALQAAEAHYSKAFHDYKQLEKKVARVAKAVNVLEDAENELDLSSSNGRRVTFALSAKRDRQECVAKEAWTQATRYGSHERFWQQVERFIQNGEVHHACSEENCRVLLPCFLHSEFVGCGYAQDVDTGRLLQDCPDEGDEVISNCPGCMSPAADEMSTQLDRESSGAVECSRVGKCNEYAAAEMGRDFMDVHFFRATYTCRDCHGRLEVFLSLYVLMRSICM